jgi:hypothetical protein
MQNAKRKAAGAALAMAVAGLVGCAANAGGSSAPEAAAAAATNNVDMMHCFGANICKGHNDCKTASNACAGQGSCKGEGFVGVPVSACDDIGGEKKDDFIWQVSAADLIHCSGVNVCKGHNDCKTATNACAGHATCKGTGFVAIPAKACADIGGKVDS